MPTKPRTAAGYKSDQVAHVRFAPLLAAEEASQGLRFLDEDFAEVDSVGPARVAEFLYGEPNDAAAADAWASVRDFVDAARAH